VGGCDDDVKYSGRAESETQFGDVAASEVFFVCLLTYGPGGTMKNIRRTKIDLGFGEDK